MGAWINSTAYSEAAPSISSTLPMVNGRIMRGFLDLIEARFIKDFGRLSQTIQEIAARLRAPPHRPPICNERGVPQFERRPLTFVRSGTKSQLFGTQ